MLLTHSAAQIGIKITTATVLWASIKNHTVLLACTPVVRFTGQGLVPLIHRLFEAFTSKYQYCSLKKYLSFSVQINQVLAKHVGLFFGRVLINLKMGFIFMGFEH